MWCGKFVVFRQQRERGRNMFAGTVFTFDLPPVVAHFTTTAAFSLCVTGLIF